MISVFKKNIGANGAAAPPPPPTPQHNSSLSPIFFFAIVIGCERSLPVLVVEPAGSPPTHPPAAAKLKSRRLRSAAPPTELFQSQNSWALHMLGRFSFQPLCAAAAHACARAFPRCCRFQAPLHRSVSTASAFMSAGRPLLSMRLFSDGSASSTNCHASELRKVHFGKAFPAYFLLTLQFRRAMLFGSRTSYYRY